MAAKIKIDGVEYDFPDPESLTLDESIVLERYSAVTLDKLRPGESMPIGVIKALLVIAVRRARPDVSEREIADRVGSMKIGELEQVMPQQEAEAVPPVGALPDSSASTQLSGEHGSNGSASPPVPSTLLGSGSRSSDISSISDPVTSAS